MGSRKKRELKQEGKREKIIEESNYIPFWKKEEEPRISQNGNWGNFPTYLPEKEETGDSMSNFSSLEERKEKKTKEAAW